jgi:phage terminase Nu1 subunit (DNA packaging protein)
MEGDMAKIRNGAEAAAAGGAETLEAARARRPRAMADRAELEAQRLRGGLVDRAKATALVHRLAREERDAILAWPARVAAEMAAELGVDAHRLQTMMDARLRAHLAARHDVRVQVS